MLAYPHTLYSTSLDEMSSGMMLAKFDKPLISHEQRSNTVPDQLTFWPLNLIESKITSQRGSGTCCIQTGPFAAS